jgi:hypothetical protein
MAGSEISIDRHTATLPECALFLQDILSAFMQLHAISLCVHIQHAPWVWYLAAQAAERGELTKGSRRYLPAGAFSHFSYSAQAACRSGQAAARQHSHSQQQPHATQSRVLSHWLECQQQAACACMVANTLPLPLHLHPWAVRCQEQAGECLVTHWHISDHIPITGPAVLAMLMVLPLFLTPSCYSSILPLAVCGCTSTSWSTMSASPVITRPCCSTTLQHCWADVVWVLYRPGQAASKFAGDPPRSVPAA